MLMRYEHTAASGDVTKAALTGNPIAPGHSSSNSLVAVRSVSAVSVPFKDGKDLHSIRQWAHNELEVERMLEENNRIIRRQLVTFKETPAAAIERSRLTGESVRSLTLPGLDGEEIEFEITKSDVEPSGLRGMFSGHVAGYPDALETLAFAKNKQAYTVLSPSAGIYLTADAHDSGDAILKGIDPNVYASGICSNP